VVEGGGVLVIAEVYRHLLVVAHGHVAAGHVIHFLFLGAAVLVFLAFVAVDVRRHGWPRFSWRGDQTGPNS
jgi:hypothetical protein